jgi:uncharacterized coiled-coil DUF342 family protein
MVTKLSAKQSEIDDLKEQRSKLRQKLAAIEADYRKGLVPDSDDRAIELENADVLEEIARTVANELESIEKRLSELANNSKEGLS